MTFIKTRKGAATFLALVAIAVSAVGAYAYFTSQGTGSGSASVGKAADDLVVTGTSDGTPLTPNGPGSVISFTVANPENFSQYLTNIDLSGVVACSAPLDGSNKCPAGDDISTTDPTDATKCDVDAFTMPDVKGITDGNIAKNATAQGITETGTLSMGDTGYSQNACENAYLALSITTT